MRHSESTKNSVKDFVSNGGSKAEAARRYNVSRSSVSRWTQTAKSNQPLTKNQRSKPIALSARGRDSTIDPYYRKGTLRTIEQPRGQRKFAIQSLKFDNLQNKNFSDTVETLINASDALSLAVDTYIDSTVDGWELEVDPTDPESVRGKEIIENFWRNAPEDAIATQKRIAYGIYVEGGTSIELTTAEEIIRGRAGIPIEIGMPVKIDYVSPFTLSPNRIEKEKSPIGEYDQIVQKTGQGVNDFVVMQDEVTPNPYYIYNPTSLRGTQKLGSSPIEPAIFTVASMIDLISMSVDWTQGRVYPKGIYQIDTDGLPNEVTLDDLKDFAKEATEALQKELDGADITQDIVLSTKLLYTLVGSLEAANIDGIDMLMEVLERIQRRALRLPNSVFGGRERGAGLGVNQEYEWLMFSRRVRSVRTEIEDPLTEFYTLILRLNGNMGEVKHKLTDSDVVYQKMLSEALEAKAKAFVPIKQLGIFSKQELRKVFQDPDINFGKLPTELPADLEGETPMMPMQPQQPNDDNAETLSHILQRLELMQNGRHDA